MQTQQYFLGKQIINFTINRQYFVPLLPISTECFVAKAFPSDMPIYINQVITMDSLFEQQCKRFFFPEKKIINTFMSSVLRFAPQNILDQY